MEHYYINVDGWFNQTKLYEFAVKKYQDARFVEVGSWKGRSASFMGVEIINSGKNIIFDCVDTFEGSPEHRSLNKQKLYEEFCKNTDPIKKVFGKVHVMRSLEAASLYEDESLDFVFIDASHDTENVYQDCNAWWPKIKKGGILSGDDYDPHAWPGVPDGIRKYFQDLHKVNLEFLPHWYILK